MEEVEVERKVTEEKVIGSQVEVSKKKGKRKNKIK